MQRIARLGTLEGLWGLGKQLYREARDDRLTGLAAEVAFFAVLSVFPGLLMLTAALGSLDSLSSGDVVQEVEKQILDFLQLVLTNRASGTVDAVRTLFEEESQGLLTVASLVALFSLSRGFAAIVRALNLTYDAEERRTWLKLRLLGLALSLGTVIMSAIVLAMIVAGPLFGGAQELADLLGLGTIFSFLWRWLRYPATFALLVAWATTLFHLAPNRPRPPWRQDLPGALLAAILWLVVSAGFNLYLQIAAGGNPVYSVLGGGLILLIWLYLLSLSLLLGGELNSLLAQGDSRPLPRAAAPD